MKSNKTVRIALPILAATIAASLLYVGDSGDATQPSAAVPASTPAPVSTDVKAVEGRLEVVTKVPKLFDPKTFNPADYSSNPKRDIEEQMVLDLVAQRGIPDETKVERLLGMIPKLPPDAQTLAMENATALIPDTTYLTFRERLLQLANTADMRVAVMDDSLTRGEDLRLPNLLEMMRTSKNDEEKLEIREIFEAYLDHDYGPDPAAWEKPLAAWVAENSDS